MKRHMGLFVRILSLALVLSLLTGWVPSAVAASEVYDREDLFCSFPKYLVNEESGERETYYIDCGLDVLDSISGGDEAVGAFLTFIRDGVDIAGEEIESWFIGSAEDKRLREYQRTLALNTMSRMLEDGELVIESSEKVNEFKEITEEFSAKVGLLKSAEEFVDAWFASDLSALGSSISAKEVSEFSDTLFDESTEGILKVGALAVDTWAATLTALMIYDLEMEALETVLEYAIPGSDLAEGIRILQEERNTDPSDYMAKTYLGQGKKALVGAVIDLVGKKFAPVAIVDTCFKVLKLSFAILSIDGDMKQMTLAMMAYSNMNTAKNALADCRIGIMTAEDVTQEQVDDYRTLYIAYLASIQEFLSRCVPLATGEDWYLGERAENAANSLAKGLDLSYAIHIQLCLEQLQADADAGRLEGVTPDSFATQNIRDRLAAIQEIYVPNANRVFDEVFSGRAGAMGFACKVFNLLYEEKLPDTTVRNRSHLLASPDTVKKLGTLSAGEVTEEAAAELLSQALPGDIVLLGIRRGSANSQGTVSVVVDADEEKITLYDCGSSFVENDQRHEIRQYDLAYAQIAAAFDNAGTGDYTDGVSLYRALRREYVSKDGTPIRYDDSPNFIIENGVLVHYTGWQSHVIIPDGVVAVGDSAFQNNSNNYMIHTITMPDSVKSVGAKAMYALTGLRRVNFSANLESIGEKAFSKCPDLFWVTLPYGLESIGAFAFADCDKLPMASLPPSVTEIGGYAFQDCDVLTSVRIPGSVALMGDYCFSHCDALETVVLADGLKKIPAYGFCSNPALKNVTLPAHLEKLGRACFGSCTALEQIDLPGTLQSSDDYNVNGTDVGPFAGCSGLKSFALGKEMTEIPFCLFKDTGLAEVEIPGHITKIGAKAFSGCKQLEKVTFPDGLTEIGGYAFQDCDVPTSVRIPGSVTAMGDYCFSHCDALETVVLADGLKKIPAYGFCSNPALKNVTLPAHLEKLGRACFGSCTALEQIDLPGTLQSSDDYNVNGTDVGPFAGCSGLKSFALGKEMTEIPFCLFKDTGLAEVEIPGHITKIGAKAFSGCKQLEKVIFPDGLTEIGGYAFQNCDALTSVRIPGSVTAVGDYCFSNNDGLQSVVLSDSLGAAGNHTFSGCTALEKVTVRGFDGDISQTGLQYLPGVTVVAYEGSAAQVYAEENGVSCRTLLHENPEERPDGAPVHGEALTLLRQENQITARVLLDGEAEAAGVFLLALYDDDGMMRAVYTTPFESGASDVTVRLEGLPGFDSFGVYFLGGDHTPLAGRFRGTF